MEARIVLKNTTRDDVQKLIEEYIQTAVQTLHLHYEKRVNEIFFYGDGKKDDYSNIFLILTELVMKDWFVEHAETCWFIRNGCYEDILAQVPAARERLGDYYDIERITTA